MSSKRRIRRNACGNKRRFDTKEAALSVAMIVKRKSGTFQRINVNGAINFIGVIHD